MPAKKITSLTALAVAPATDDVLPIVDLSDTTDAATGTTKKITVANLFTTPTIGSMANANHNHEDAAGGGQIDSDALSGAVSIAKGGTGQTTNTAAFDALAPTTTAGDIIYHNGSDNIRLAKGGAGQVLTINSGGTAPEWGVPGKIYQSTTEVTFTDGNGGNGAGVEKSVFSTTIPAGTLGTNNGIKFKCFISGAGNDGGAGSLIIKINLGGTTILTLTAGGGGSNALTGMSGFLEGYILADGATNAQKVSAKVFISDNKSEDSGDTSVSVSSLYIGGTAAGAKDSTSALAFEIAVTMSSNAASDGVFEWLIVGTT